jgi:hypothetical protein
MAIIIFIAVFIGRAIQTVKKMVSTRATGCIHEDRDLSLRHHRLWGATLENIPRPVMAISYPVVPSYLSQEINWLERETDYSPSISEVYNAWRLTSIPPIKHSRLASYARMSLA